MYGITCLAFLSLGIAPTLASPKDLNARKVDSHTKTVTVTICGESCVYPVIASTMTVYTGCSENSPLSSSSEGSESGQESWTSETASWLPTSSPATVDYSRTSENAASNTKPVITYSAKDSTAAPTLGPTTSTCTETSEEAPIPSVGSDTTRPDTAETTWAAAPISSTDVLPSTSVFLSTSSGTSPYLTSTAHATTNSTVSASSLALASSGDTQESIPCTIISSAPGVESSTAPTPGAPSSTGTATTSTYGNATVSVEWPSSSALSTSGTMPIGISSSSSGTTAPTSWNYPLSSRSYSTNRSSTTLPFIWGTPTFTQGGTTHLTVTRTRSEVVTVYPSASQSQSWSNSTAVTGSSGSLEASSSTLAEGTTLSQTVVETSAQVQHSGSVPGTTTSTSLDTPSPSISLTASTEETTSTNQTSATAPASAPTSTRNHPVSSQEGSVTLVTTTKSTSTTWPGGYTYQPWQSHPESQPLVKGTASAPTTFVTAHPKKGHSRSSHGSHDSASTTATRYRQKFEH